MSSILPDWDLKATWDAAYSSNAERHIGGHPNTRPAIRLHYDRAAMMPGMEQRVDQYESILGWAPPGPTIVIMGAGFGWTVEVLETRGYTRVVAADVSKYVEDNQDETEEADVRAAITLVGLDPDTGDGAIRLAQLWDGGTKGRSSRKVKPEDGLKKISRTRLLSAVGLGANDKFDHYISELLLSSFNDLEITTFAPDLHLYALDVTHLVEQTADGTTYPAEYNIKEPSEWKTILPNDRIIQDAMWVVF